MNTETNPLRAEIRSPRAIRILRTTSTGNEYEIGGLTRNADGTWKSYVLAVGTTYSRAPYPTAEDAAKARWKKYGRDAVRAALLLADVKNFATGEGPTTFVGCPTGGAK